MFKMYVPFVPVHTVCVRNTQDNTPPGMNFRDGFLRKTGGYTQLATKNGDLGNISRSFHRHIALRLHPLPCRETQPSNEIRPSYVHYVRIYLECFLVFHSSTYVYDIELALTRTDLLSDCCQGPQTALCAATAKQVRFASSRSACTRTAVRSEPFTASALCVAVYIRRG